MTKRIQRGFTLYELLITVLIVAVIMSFGIPNLRDYRQNARMTNTANELHAAFHFARSESSRAKENITICASSDSMAAAPTCTGNWNQGYIVFVDTDGNIATGGVNESILRRQPATDAGVIFAVANDAKYFSFSANGLGRQNVNGNPAISQVVLCDQRGNITAAGGNSAARLFVATPLGRAMILRDKTMINDALTAMSKTCP